MAKEAGFDASQMLKADWELLKAQQTIELSDDELEQVSGGGALQTVAVPVTALPTQMGIMLMQMGININQEKI